MAIISEAGWYAGSFRPQAVRPGDSWIGATTASGGCTSGKFTLKGYRSDHGAEIADFEVTEIAMGGSDQVGPMKMTVDVSSGLVTYMDYSVKRRSSGTLVHFVQKLLMTRVF